MSENPYQTIKRSIAEGIARGQWAEGDLLPSEHALCRSFGVSRMTVNRAMRELAAESLVRRVPGVGTFVAEPAAQSALLEIHNIADEIAARGHSHSAIVRHLGELAAPPAIAVAFDMLPGSRLFHSLILHRENDTPLQLEDRYVNPGVAPGYLDQDFSLITPNAFLMRVAPLSQVEHMVQAMRPDAEIAAALALAEDEPCLLVTRRTWTRQNVATYARLYHPGSRFRLGGRFAPPPAAAILPFALKEPRHG